MAPATYPPIADYGLISDCHSVALVSLTGSIDWCCMPRADSDSCFGRLLDWRKGGRFGIEARDLTGCSTFRAYLEGTMVLTTSFITPTGEVRLVDFFGMREGGKDEPYRELVRIVEGVRGKVEMTARIAPVFDYGEVRPWLRHTASNTFVAIGGDSGLLISSDDPLEIFDRHELDSRFTVRAGNRHRFAVRFVEPQNLDVGSPAPSTAEEIDRRLEETVQWWRRWGGKAHLPGSDGAAALRSAMVLKALSNAPSGAIAAAATTSLPEEIGGTRNWDYRFSWIRDSSFSVRALADAGLEGEADGFRRFIERSSAGSASELQIMYGLGGERRLTEVELSELEGYRGSRPVRIGNAAAHQLQHDAYGELLNLAWRWHQRGHSPDDDYWRFLVDLVDVAAERWQEPDCGIWEIRGQPRHFVHSKAMCWIALDRGLKLAAECLRKAPVGRWRRSAREVRAAIDEHGYDRRRGVYVQHFGARAMDAALLLLPSAGYVAWDDERMIRTADAVAADLSVSGLLLRYRPRRTLDGQSGREGVFLACTFWLAECYAHQGRLEEAREVFDRAVATGNDIGLFAEEFDPVKREMLGNFPQALSHLSHLTAWAAMAGAQAALRGTDVA